MRRRRLAAVLLLLGALVALVLAGSSPREPQPAAAPRAIAASPVARASADAADPARARVDAVAPGPEGAPASLCTFVDGVPVPSLVRDVKIWTPADWTAAAPRHPVPEGGDRFAVIARDCRIVLLARADLPQCGEKRIDMTRAPVLDVRLVNVPPTLRDKLRLLLQLEYGQLDTGENIASILVGRGPFEMNEDRVLVPLALPQRGELVVHAQSRYSTHSYPTPKVSFEPVSQVIEIDLSVLAPACSLADLSLTLRFPYAHPDGELDLSLLDVDGSTMMFQRRVRRGEKELAYQFRDLPPVRVQPLLNGKSVTTSIYLPAIELRAGGNAVERDVVAESSLRVVLSGREGLAADGVGVLLRTEDGDALPGSYPTGNEARFEHLPAMTLFVQAFAHEGRRCSTVATVTLGVAQSHEVALHLVAGAMVHVPSNAFGAAVRRLDVHQPGHGTSPFGLRPGRRALVWLPLGDARVTWDGGSRTFRVEPGVINLWN